METQEIEEEHGQELARLASLLVLLAASSQLHSL